VAAFLRIRCGTAVLDSGEGKAVELPRPFLLSRFSNSEQNPRINCICPGFELRQWRYERLAAHLIDWLPDFAIRHDDLPPVIENLTDYRKLIEDAAERIYKTDKSDSRGEIGELILHTICRQFSGTFPSISKVYYKDSSNDVVKGFDLVHTRYDDKTKELQLWLGEAKFYSSGAEAVREAVNSIRAHLDKGFLTSEKILLGSKISTDTPGYEQLKWLFDRDTQLDHIFQRLVIPILIAYDSPTAASYENDESYDANLLSELAVFQKAITGRLPSNISVYCYYFPMHTKKALVEHFDKRLGGFR
jgi:Cap4 SAVED domain